MTPARQTLAVVGHGMVGHKLLQALVERGAGGYWDIVVFGEERSFAYDRVHLSALFEGSNPAELSLAGPELHDPAVQVRTGERVVAIDRTAQALLTDRGRVQRYDVAVLATGSVPFVPPVPGRELPGCFVYRTLDDVKAIQAWSAQASRGVVVGGGLLGLEAANALRCCGVAVEVVEPAPWLMPAQVDETGGRILERRIRALGIEVHTSTAVAGLEAGPAGRIEAAALQAAAGGPAAQIAADIAVFSAGIRPRDGLARRCGLQVAERGGVVVDEQCRTSDPAIFAVGECASAGGTVYGLVSPGYQMARVVADTVCGTASAFKGAELSAKLKLLGVDVASFGDAHARTPGAVAVSFTDEPGAVHKRLVLDGAGRLLGGILVGDAAGYEALAQMARGDLPTPAEPAVLIAPPGQQPGLGAGLDALADTAMVCSCENVTKGAIRAAVAASIERTGTAKLAAVKAACRAGTGCGGCVPQLTALLRAGLAQAGVALSNHLCEHFPYTRAELFDIVKVRGIATFAELLAAHGTGVGCEVCKPVVASILVSAANRYVLDDDLAGLQDTNDHFLANMQRDGTYSVVPRIPGGEITPEKLVVLGEVARDFGLYTKVTGGQRIDLLGARVEQLPAIWARLVAAGFESGHAYGKALRTVKSCVGAAWCRYGVQDSTALAVDLELRYRGLRSPHKIKMAVSGCARECAEAQGKDVGVIATERGWNLYVGGNGGTRPRHADLLAEDLDTAALIQAIDRFVMYYIATADRLQRTASWLEQLDGGLPYLRGVIFDDALGIGAELDARMARHVAAYRCEWKATLDDPHRLARFRTFVNSGEPDPDIVFVTDRGQPRPARPSGGSQMLRSHS